MHRYAQIPKRILWIRPFLWYTERKFTTFHYSFPSAKEVLSMSSNYQDTSRTAKTIASTVSSKQDSHPRSASLHFIKVNPAGNITILVDTPIEDKSRPTIANQLMAYNHLHAEQVGFLSYPSNGSPREIPIRLDHDGRRILWQCHTVCCVLCSLRTDASARS